MSYARFSNADVYVYLDCDGYLNCCACSLNADESDALFPGSTHCHSTDEMLAHLAEHVAAGHDVPASCTERLAAEREENDAFMAGETP
jgi:hypothetical protein